jgi:hypothetical protein
MKRLAVVLISILCFLLAGEAFFRVFYPQSLYSLTYAPYGWKHIPNTEVTFYGEHPDWRWKLKPAVKVKYNSLGLRGNEPEPSKFPILILGDSYAEDMGSWEDNLVSTHLERMLDFKFYPEQPFRYHQVINAGCYAYDNAQEYLYYLYEGRSYKPKIVLLFYACDEASPEYARTEGGYIIFTPKSFTTKQKIYRNIVSMVRLHSHFGSWFLNRISRVPRVNNYLIKNGMKESARPVVNPDTTRTLRAGEIDGGVKFKDIDASIYLALNSAVKNNGGVLVMVNCVTDWSLSQKYFMESNGIQYVNLDFKEISYARDRRDFDVRSGLYNPRIESHRFGYGANEVVASQIYSALEEEKLIPDR